MTEQSTYRNKMAFSGYVGDRASSNIEKQCHNRAVETSTFLGIVPSAVSFSFISLYKDICIEMLYKLENNRDLCDKIKEKPHISNEILTKIKSDLSKEIDEFNRRRNVKLNEKYSKTSTCPRCQSKDTVKFETKQTRAGDEMATIIITCTKCGYGGGGKK